MEIIKLKFINIQEEHPLGKKLVEMQPTKGGLQETIITRSNPWHSWMVIFMQEYISIPVLVMERESYGSMIIPPGL